jgi:S-adenosylmethionine:tRNA ribosyltransferase-isomerase
VQLEDLAYDLPAELIAQAPAPERTGARLLVMGSGDRFVHARMASLPDQLVAGDLLVLNDTRVIPARVRGRRPSGGRIEVLLCEPVGEQEWAVLAKGSPRVGERIEFSSGSGEWTADRGEGRWHLRLDVGPSVLDWLAGAGELPLPPYIRRPEGPTVDDHARYQTVFARTPGAVAAPTAGLHFTPELFAALSARGIGYAFVTLHVGPGTFMPIRGGDLETYTMAAERYVVGAEAAQAVALARGERRRIVAVGTTVVRALESAASSGELVAKAGDADLFIAPGHVFRMVDAMITNFHLPRTPLLAMVAALAGWERTRRAYEEAVRERYRFYSYGDAMLVQ